jgi:hypothetical protein
MYLKKFPVFVDLTEWVIGWEVEGICFVVEPMEVFKAE